MSLPAPQQWLRPEWQHHPRVGACVTTRLGNWSPPPWQGFNLGLNCEDDSTRVLQARDHVSATLGMPVAWLRQVHGTGQVVAPLAGEPPAADAVLTRQPGVACAVLTADCLPVLMARRDGTAVAAVHAGWRGLLDGILEQSVQALAGPGEALDIWVGPGICQACYQVGAEVREAFVARDAAASACFRADGPGHWRCDLPALAQGRLAQAGQQTQLSGLCTVCDNDRFYSHRHEAQTGRFASLIWLNESS